MLVVVLLLLADGAVTDYKSVSEVHDVLMAPIVVLRVRQQRSCAYLQFRSQLLWDSTHFHTLVGLGGLGGLFQAAVRIIDVTVVDALLGTVGVNSEHEVEFE